MKRKMLDCTQAVVSIQSGMDGRLSPSERAALDTHLSGCVACRAAWDEYRRLAQVTTSWTQKTLVSDDPGAAFTEQVMARIASGQIPSTPRFTRPALAFILCCVLVLTALSLWAGPQMPTVSLAALMAHLSPHAVLSFNSWEQMTAHIPHDTLEIWTALTTNPIALPRWIGGALAAAFGINAFFIQRARRQVRAIPQ